MDVWIVTDDEGSISGVYTTHEIANKAANIAEFDPDDAVEHWEVSETAGDIKGEADELRALDKTLADARHMLNSDHTREEDRASWAEHVEYLEDGRTQLMARIARKEKITND